MTMIKIIIMTTITAMTLSLYLQIYRGHIISNAALLVDWIHSITYCHSWHFHQSIPIPMSSIRPLTVASVCATHLHISELLYSKPIMIPAESQGSSCRYGINDVQHRAPCARLRNFLFPSSISDTITLPNVEIVEWWLWLKLIDNNDDKDNDDKSAWLNYLTLLWRLLKGFQYLMRMMNRNSVVYWLKIIRTID